MRGDHITGGFETLTGWKDSLTSETFCASYSMCGKFHRIKRFASDNLSLIVERAPFYSNPTMRGLYMTVTREWILSRSFRQHPLARLFKNCKVSDSGCWEIQSNLDRCGYGRFKIGGRQLGAHKVAYILLVGDFDQEKYEVMHKCDNPRCINPEHLTHGTHFDNIKDAVVKGRITVLNGLDSIRDRIPVPPRKG